VYSNIPANLRKTRDIWGAGGVPQRTTTCHEGGGGSKSGLKKATWFVYGPLHGTILTFRNFESATMKRMDAAARSGAPERPGLNLGARIRESSQKSHPPALRVSRNSQFKLSAAKAVL